MVSLISYLSFCPQADPTLFFGCMSHRVFLYLRRPEKQDCKGRPPFAGGQGVSPCFLSPISRRLRRRANEGKRVLRGHPAPRQGLCPCTPGFFDTCSKNSG